MIAQNNQRFTTKLFRNKLQAQMITINLQGKRGMHSKLCVCYCGAC
jgi:hypothetical protein